VEAVLTVGDLSRSRAVTQVVDVSRPQASTTEVSGAAFPVPDSLEEEVESYRSEAGVDLEAQAFVLATQDEVFVVFTSEEPQEGIASVSGIGVQRDLSAEDMSFGVIAANSVSFETTGTEAGVTEVSENPNDYRLDLVRISATHRQVSTLTDPDQGEDFTAAVTFGRLIENPRTVQSVLQNPGSKARALNENLQANSSGSVLADTERDHVGTVSFEQQMWTDTRATVDGIVLVPGSEARQYIETFGSGGVDYAEEGVPLVYVVNSELDPQPVDSIQEIKEQSSSLDGEVVSVEANLYQGRLSAQETLEHNTACGQDRIQVQSGCVNVPQDFLIHTGIAWNTGVDSRDDLIPILAGSATHQDAPVENTTGSYRIVGEVVSTSRIDESLPEGSMLLVYELERTGDIEYRDLSTDLRQRIVGQTDTFRSRFSADVLNEELNDSVDSEESPVLREISAGETESISNPSQPDGSLEVNEVSITASENIQDAEVTISDESTISESVEDPPGNQINLLNISVSASDSEVEEATIRLEVSKSNIPADSQLQVYRYNDGDWEELETRRIDENSEVVILEAETPGFSPFAVSYTSDNSVDNTAGGNSIAPIVGLISVTTSLGGLVISGIGVLLIVGAAIGKITDSRLTNISFKTAILVFVGGILLFIISVIVSGISFLF
jgi:PGF-pre-PGF domain-containing protein